MSTDECVFAAPLAPANLLTWDEHQRINAQVFPSAESWRWFVRQHRAELIERGALCYLAGRLFVLPAAFDDAVIAIGKRLAAARAA